MIFAEEYRFAASEETQMMELACREIAQTDLVIAEVSHKAIGVGVEVGYAIGIGKPVVYVVKGEGVYEPREEISPERSLIAKQTAAGVLTALKALPPRTAEAFLLHRFEEMTYAAIAAHMGVSVKAVEALIARAMKRVGAALEARP